MTFPLFHFNFSLRVLGNIPDESAANKAIVLYYLYFFFSQKDGIRHLIIVSSGGILHETDFRNRKTKKPCNQQTEFSLSVFRLPLVVDSSSLRKKKEKKKKKQILQSVPHAIISQNRNAANSSEISSDRTHLPCYVNVTVLGLEPLHFQLSIICSVKHDAVSLPSPSPPPHPSGGNPSKCWSVSRGFASLA